VRKEGKHDYEDSMAGFVRSEQKHGGQNMMSPTSGIGRNPGKHAFSNLKLFFQMYDNEN
jgi:hypothetical protein